MIFKRSFIARRKTPKQSRRSGCFAALAAAALIFVCTSANAAESPLFQKANEKYRAADFKSALETYQKLLQTGQTTAAVYYNLGNAALKSGAKGQALVYYERARKAAPRDEDLKWNVGVLKDSLKDRVEDRAHFALVAVKSFLDGWALHELALCFTAFLALAALLSIAGFFSARLPVRTFWPLVIAALVFSGALFALKAWDAKDPRAVVLDKETTAYYGPSDGETKAFVLHEGAEGRVTDESGDWLYISLQNKNAGWVRKNACEIV